MTPTTERWKPDEALLLAAVDRAERHLPQGGPGVLLSDITNHLGLGRSRGASRRLRPVLQLLADDRGWLEHHHRLGMAFWAITADGADVLTEAFPDGVGDALPESPQHRAWREARAEATRMIGILRADLTECLDEIAELAAADPPPMSDEWLALAEPVRDALRRVGVASYCLREWDEPDDSTADLEQEDEKLRWGISRRHYPLSAGVEQEGPP